MQIETTLITFAAWLITFLLVINLYQHLNTKLWLLALTIYLVPAFYLPTIQDVGLFETVGIKFLERIDFYAFDGLNHGTFPFLPFMNWFYATAHMLSKLTNLPFIFFVRLLMIAAVFGTTILIGKLNKTKRAKKDQLFFLFNPVNLLVFSLHGQADILLILFALISVYLLTSKNKPVLKSAIAMSISVLIKTWSVIFIPLFLLKFRKFSQRSLWLLVQGVMIFLIVGFYIKLFRSSFALLVETLTSHVGGAPGYWGYTGFFRLISMLEPSVSSLVDVLEAKAVHILIIAFATVYLIIIKKRISLLPSMVLILLSFMLVTPGWGFQYTVWVLPFAAASAMSKNSRIYSYLAIPYLSLTYLLVIPESLLKSEILTTVSIALGIPLWAYVAYWLFQLVKKEYQWL